MSKFIPNYQPVPQGITERSVDTNYLTSPITLRVNLNNELEMLCDKFSSLVTVQKQWADAMVKEARCSRQDINNFYISISKNEYWIPIHLGWEFMYSDGRVIKDLYRDDRIDHFLLKHGHSTFDIHVYDTSGFVGQHKYYNFAIDDIDQFDASGNWLGHAQLIITIKNPSDKTLQDHGIVK